MRRLPKDLLVDGATGAEAETDSVAATLGLESVDGVAAGAIAPDVVGAVLT